MRSLELFLSLYRVKSNIQELIASARQRVLPSSHRPMYNTSIGNIRRRKTPVTVAQVIYFQQKIYLNFMFVDRVNIGSASTNLNAPLLTDMSSVRRQWWKVLWPSRITVEWWMRMGLLPSTTRHQKEHIGVLFPTNFHFRSHRLRRRNANIVFCFCTCLNFDTRSGWSV